MSTQTQFCLDVLPLWAAATFITLTAITNAAVVERRPLQRETKLGDAEAPAAVILVPDDTEYRELGQQLAADIAKQTGVQLEVRAAKDYVSHRPRIVKTDALDKNFILLGQFWNNAVLERLYARYFDPTDAFFPGTNGYELRTVCSPFRYGHNCVAATGSDLEGCKKAAAQLPLLIQKNDAGSYIPFLHTVRLGGEAAVVEADYRRRAAPYLAELERYVTFGHPQAKTWTGENPRDFLVWKDRNLATATCFGLRFWATGEKEDAEAFKRLIFRCMEHLDRLERAYREGRSDLVEYSLCGLTIAWDLIEETDAFNDAERQQITDYLFQLAYLNRDKYFIYKCKDLPLADVKFYNRHQIAAMFWIGAEASYLTRNCALTDEQRKLRDDWRANARHYFRRLSQSYFYSDGVQLIHDEGGIVTRWALMTGDLDFADNGSLRSLADYWVANHDNLKWMASSGHCGNTRHGPAGGEVLNAAGWLFPGEGYQWFRRRLGRWPYMPFISYMATSIGLRIPYFNWETPPTDDGAGKLKDRMTGVCVLPIGKAFDDYLRRYPDMWQGGYQRLPGRYHYDPAPYEQSFKRIALRSGFEKDDQYLVLDGMQGIEWSYDDINAIVRYCDLGQPLLKSQWDARNVESRLEMNTLFVSNGVPGAKQSVAARLLTAADMGPDALLCSLAPRHDGVAWRRRCFWRKRGWFLIADEVSPHSDGDYFLAQTWLSWHPFRILGNEAAARANDVTLHIVGTPERRFALAEGGEGVRQKVSARLNKDRPFILWTLLYANGPSRPGRWTMRRISPGMVMLAGIDIQDGTPQRVLAFTGGADLGGLRLTAEMGLISSKRLTLAGCRELTIDGKPLISAPSGYTLGWDLATNTFEEGKGGFGRQEGAELPNLFEQRGKVAATVQECLAAAARHFSFLAPEARAAVTVKAPPLTVTDRLELTPPVSLAAADLDDDGEDELLLYDADGNPRFDNISFRCAPVAVDFDGEGQRDIAFALDKEVVVYRTDGSLRWRRTLTNTVNCLSVGDLDGDGREDLGLSQWNWVTVLNYEGRRLIDEEVYRYNGIAGALGDVDGDGVVELVAVTCSGVNVLTPGRTRRTVAWQSFFGVSPGRIWLRDLDGDNVLECYVGGGGSDPACYDLRAMKCRWRFAGAALHPLDAALCDIDGDGRPEMVSGGGDGFLYVVGSDGAFRFSRSVGAGVTAMATVPLVAGESGALAVGLETGKLLLLGRDLQPLGEASVGEPVTHLAVLGSVDNWPTIVAAGDSGRALFVEW